jgi:hypothetical protein
LTDLNEFFRLKDLMKKGFSLTGAEKMRYRVLGKQWKQHYRRLHDDKGVKSIDRDLNMLNRQVRDWLEKSVVVEADVLK